MIDEPKPKGETPDEFLRRIKKGLGPAETPSEQIGKGFFSSSKKKLQSEQIKEITRPFDPSTREEATERSAPPREIWHYPPLKPEQIKEADEQARINRARLNEHLQRQEAQRRRMETPEFKAKRAEIEAAAKARSEGRRPTGRIDLIESLKDPIPVRVRQRLAALATQKRFSDIWSPFNEETQKFYVETLYDALYSFAVRLCQKFELPSNDTGSWKSDIALESRQKTVMEIYKISMRDGRRTINDQRISQDKPKFTDWVKYIGWAHNILEHVVLRTRKGFDIEVSRTAELTGQETDSPLPAQPVRPAAPGPDEG